MSSTKLIDAFWLYVLYRYLSVSLILLLLR